MWVLALRRAGVVSTTLLVFSILFETSRPHQLFSEPTLAPSSLIIHTMHGFKQYLPIIQLCNTKVLKNSWLIYTIILFIFTQTVFFLSAYKLFITSFKKCTKTQLKKNKYNFFLLFFLDPKIRHPSEGYRSHQIPSEHGQQAQTREYGLESAVWQAKLL